MSNNIENITKWVKTALGTDKCSLKIEGTNAVGEGYLSDLSFVRVVLTEKVEELHLIVKICKNDPKLKEMTAQYFKREIFFYEEMMPLLLSFQEDKTVMEPFTAFPKCYKVFTDGDIDVIVLENLKKRGFVTLPRNSNLDVEHFKLILKNYAKFHALSFALSDQRKDIFEEFAKRCSYLPMFSDSNDAIERAKPKIIKNLKEAGRPDLAEKYEELMKKGAIRMSVDAYNDVPKQRVIAHGDCHIANMLFKYKDGNKTNLQEITLIDFQLARMHSPMIDLANLFHFTISKQCATNFKELLEYYYQELTSFLAELGTDVTEVFPQSVMWEHWAKYTIKPFLTACTFLELLFTDDISNFAEALTSNINVNFDNQIRAKYLDRLITVADFYLNNDIYRNGNVVTR